MKFKQKKVIPSSIWDVIRLPLSLINGGFTLSSSLRPWREKSLSRSVLMRDGAGRMRGYSLGFTLMEILIVVVIIGILGAIALPQYQRAVLKSRYAGLMPIAKAMANSNEAYFLEHGVYAANAQDLPVQGRQNYPDGTELEFGTSSDYSYVLATRDNNFPNNYIVYQKHSGQFPGEIHCEADANDTKAQEVCKSFGPTEDIGETLTSGYLTYILSGTGNGVAPTENEGENDEPEEPQMPTCEGVSCDDQGNITECASGQTLNNGNCEDCATAFPGASACSATSYAATSCNEGYELSYAGACVDYAKLQARAVSLCPANQSTYTCTTKNGAVYRCNKTYGKIDSVTGECVSNGTSNGYYERIYDADGKEIGYYRCIFVASGHCYWGATKIPAGDGFKQVERICKSNAAITKEGLCANGYSSGHDSTYDSHDSVTSYSVCSASAISITTGKCGTYTTLYTYGNSDRMNGYGYQSFVEKKCTTASDSNPESTCSGSYQPVYSIRYNEAGTAYKQVRCYNAGNSSSDLNTDGTCPSGYSVKSYDAATGEYTTCGTTAASVNWETATCS